MKKQKPTPKAEPAYASQIVAAGRELLGTRWQHQGRSQLGIDCCGFIVEVSVKSIPGLSPDFARDYQREENGERMLELLQRHLIPVPERPPEDFDPEQHSSVARNTWEWRWADSLPGDVLALVDAQFKYPEIPRHLMFMTSRVPYWKGIHASEHGVVEHRLDIQFKRRIHSVWRVPGLVADLT